MSTGEQPKCRRCSECQGEEHHWLEDGSPAEECPHGEAGEQSMATNNGWCKMCIDEAPDYVCKHCPATGEMCMNCSLMEPEVEPIDCKECRGTGVILNVPT